MNNRREINCKYCKSDAIIKFGTYKGTQLYWCKSCKRKFKGDDSLFHMKMPANLVTSALNMYYEGLSIKAIARNLKQEQGTMPSTATIYEWIQKYTQYATDSIKDYKLNPKAVGDTWVADETVIEIDGNNVWLWDIIDDESRFLLATRISGSRTTKDAQILIDKAIKTAGKEPKLVLTDKLQAYLDVRYGKEGEHRQAGIARAEDNTQKIERFHETLKQRTKTMRGLKNIESAREFLDGWLVHYNYLRPHTALDDMTPAEVAGIDYPYKNWSDIIRKHRPTRHISIEHQPRTSLRLKDISFGKPRKRRPKKSQTIKRKLAQVSAITSSKLIGKQ